MNTRDFIMLMTREDFELFEKRRLEVFLPTKEEIAEKEKNEFEKKLKTFNDVMESHCIDINPKEIRLEYRENRLNKYFNTNWSRFAKGLGNEYVYADLTQVAKNMPKSKTIYKDFIDLVYKFDKNDILNCIK